MIGVNLSDWALRHRSLVAYFMIVAVIAGVLSYFRLGRNEDPAFIIKTMVVQAAWPGATVEETTMARGLLLWLLGVPIPVIILLWLFFGH